MPHSIPPEGLLEPFRSSLNIPERNIQNSEIKSKEEDFSNRPLIFKNRQALGDILMMTCLIRDFKKQFPKSRINVITTASHIWDNNIYLDRSLNAHNAEIIEIGPRYLTNASNRDDRHFANAFRISAEEKLGVSIAQGPIKPDIWMTKEEIEAPPIVEPPYWIIVAGEKGDWTAKTYPFYRWQEFVRRRNYIKFVQLGASEHKHPVLVGDNIINLVGKTQGREDGIRRLFKLFYHAEGSIGLVSFQTHLAAVFNIPCIVIAGAREPARFTRYPGQQYLCTDGCLPCASVSACWHCNLEEKCKDIVGRQGETFPKCIDLIGVNDIIRAFDQYYEGKRLNLDKPRIVSFSNIVKKQVNKEQDFLDEIIDPLWEKEGLSWGGGSITKPDYDYIRTIIEDIKPKEVLEFGAGLSTLLFKKFDFDLITYETNPNWIKKIRLLDPNCDIRLWDGTKDFSVFPINLEFDLIFVDGPPGGENREWSIKLASLYSDNVIIHDAGRVPEMKWQEKYLKEDFRLSSRGGSRCHFWKRKEKEEKIIIEDTSKKLLRIIFNGRGEGGAERSVNYLISKFLREDYNVEYYSPNQLPCKTFQLFGSKQAKFIPSIEPPSSSCDVLVLYCNDYIWEFSKEDVARKIKDFKAKKRIMVVNYKLGEIGNLPWTREFDKYIFLNSSLKFKFFERCKEGLLDWGSLYNKELIVLSPPVEDISEFFNNEIDYSGRLKLIRHSSQGNAKYPKDFNEKIREILKRFPNCEIHLMPGPSFLDDFKNRVITHPRNSPKVSEFLRLGNCFWYSLPDNYTEGGPRVVMEAMASGLPIIADNHSGTKDRVMPMTGILCDNFKDQTEAMYFFSNPENRRRFGGNAKIIAKKRFIPMKWFLEIIK